MAKQAPDRDPDDSDWLNTPATFVDYYEGSYITEAFIVRLAFGEYAGKNRPPIMRTAIAMPISDVKVLAKTLNEWVAAYDNFMEDYKKRTAHNEKE